ncbi:MAG: hypothetical protein U1E17_04230 [Geminicoccaceae bacterium]
MKKLGGTPIALDAGRKDEQQISQIQTLIAQKPDAIIEQLGNIKVLNPWLKKIRDAAFPCSRSTRRHLMPSTTRPRTITASART